MTGRRIALVGLALAVATPAAADRAAPSDLRLRELPAPHPSGLAMRAAVTPAPAATARSSPTRAAGAPIDDLGRDATRRRRSDDDLLGPTSPLEEQVVFRFNLGFGLDGGKPSGKPLTSTAALDEVDAYERLRSYGLGDLALGSRGLLSPALATYLAASFRFDQPIGQTHGAIPTVHDRDEVDRVIVRSGWAEVDGFLGGRLAPLYLRAGRQYRYGVTVAQFDGVAIGYESPALSVAGFAGQRVFAFAVPGDALADAGIAGLELRLDLFELRRLPLVLSLSSLEFASVSNLETSIALRWSPDVLIRGSLRTRDGAAARQRLALWGRLSEVTTINVELDHRTEADWMYDLLFASRAAVLAGPTPDGGLDVRRWLDVGAPLPRTILDVRAGTVLLRNLDVLARVGLGIEHRDDRQAASAFTADYVEAGGAVEVRLRRNLRLGTSLTARRYGRTTPIAAPDTADPDPLPAAGELGVRTAYEGGARIHYTAGARRFSAWTEVYGRAFRHLSHWPTADDALDLRTGGRFGVEGWAGKRLRVRAEYDVSIAQLRYAPELLGVKTLRLLTEGSF